MLNDTEAPSAPLEWAAPIHGELVLVDRVQAESWELMDDDAAAEETVVIEGVLSTVDRGAGSSLLVKSREEGSKSCLVNEGGAVLVITHLGGDGGPDIKVAARDVPDDAYVMTDLTFTAGFVGVVLFDGSQSWEMASERMLYVFTESKKGDYSVEVAQDQTTDSDKRFQVIRLRKKD